jgi:predicted Zn-dependent protease with MMP-like domain
MKRGRATGDDWAALIPVADGEVKATIRRLAPVLREKAEQVPVVYQSRPAGSQQRDGIEADTMGVFEGAAFPEENETAACPRQIVLFLSNIRDEARDLGASFRSEVRATYLHELGHYLGLNEDALALRDL